MQGRRQRPTALTLAALVGDALAEELCARFGGLRLPNPNAADIVRRNRMIRGALDAGGTYSEVASRFRLSERHVLRIAKQGVPTAVL